jgi:hypothetical protein
MMLARSSSIGRQGVVTFDCEAAQAAGVARPVKGVARVDNVRHAHPVGLGVPPGMGFHQSCRNPQLHPAAMHAKVLIDTLRRERQDGPFLFIASRAAMRRL